MPLPPMGSANDERRTPTDLFARLHSLYDFTLDGAATHENALLRRYCTAEGTFMRQEGQGPYCLTHDDGLNFPWQAVRWGSPERVFLNPPYGRGLLAPFVRKAHYEALRHGALVVALLPVRTDQAWFHEHVLVPEARIEWLRGRVKYDGLSTGAPFPSMLVIWR